MAEKFAIARNLEKDVFREKLTLPLLFLSSEDLGWEGLIAQAYHEPIEFEGVLAPDTDISSISLVLLTGGAMYLESRPANGSWSGSLVHPEELILTSGGTTPGELRWKGLTSASMQTLHLHLSKDLLFQTAEELENVDPVRLTLANRVGFQDPLLTQIGLTLWRELELQEATGKLYAQTAAQLLAVHLLRHYTSSPLTIAEPVQGLTKQQIKRVTDFILTHLARDLSLDLLAQQTGFSSYHFARLFRRSLGESPHQFVLRLRVEKAQQLLKETEAPLAQIALESGFANQSHLTRIFKRQFGLTPKTYRQDYGNRARFCQDSQE